MLKKTLPLRQGTITAKLSDFSNFFPKKTAASFVVGDLVQNITYEDLLNRSKCVAMVLRKVLTTKDRVLLMMPPGLEFVISFFGCLYAGAIAVPAYPSRPKRGAGTLAGIAKDADIRAIICMKDALGKPSDFFHDEFFLRKVDIFYFEDFDFSGEKFLFEDIDEDSIAYLQYTSGSTSDPKGVMVSHGNVIHNCSQISNATKLSIDDTIVSWLPHYHDMGLIGGILHPLLLGAQTVLLSPAAVVQQPLRWLKVIDQFRATASGGPNFIFEQCVDYSQNRDFGDLDLSSWDVACVGAEPVRGATLNRFANAFARYGFRRSAFYPAYGLAEATVMVTGHVNQSREACSLEAPSVKEFTEDGSPVDCGAALESEKVRIVDPVRCEICSDGVEGEIWVSGPNVSKGYWRRFEETRNVFQAKIVSEGDIEYLRTGDMGFISCANLFVTGRIKDLIIIRGRNIHPEDIELTIGRSHNALAPGLGAAFSVPSGEGENLVVVHELKRRVSVDLADVADKVRRSVASVHEVAVSSLCIIKPGSIPRGTSGKVQRHLCRRAYLDGTLQLMEVDLKKDVPRSDHFSHKLILGSEDLINNGLSVNDVFVALVIEIGKYSNILSNNIQYDDKILDIGLDSIHILRIKNFIREFFSVEISNNLLFENISFEELSSFILSEKIISEIIVGNLNIESIFDLISDLSDSDVDRILSRID